MYGESVQTTCPADRLPADMFLSMLRNICPLQNGWLDKCPLETCPVGRTHDRTCLLKLVCGPVSADMFGRVYKALGLIVVTQSLFYTHIRNSIIVTKQIKYPTVNT